jgi:tetratricopeptide (TPR) repeat protein
MLPPVNRIFLVLLLLTVAGVTGGCSKQARMERLLASGNKLIEAGEFKQAEEKYRAALRMVPDEPRVLGRVGIMAYHQGRPLSAYYLLKGVQDKIPDDLDVHLTYGLSCLTLARTSEARLAAKKVLERQPDNEEALLLLAETCLTTRDNQEAQRLVEKYREGGKNTSGHHVALGALMLARGEQVEAEAEFRQALELNPKTAAAYAYLGGLALTQEKPEQAAQALKQAAGLSPLRSPRRIRYIDFLLKSGALPDARVELARILDPAPDYVPAWVLKMKVAFLEEKYEECEAATGEVLSRDRANYEALMQRAAIKLVKGDSEGVIADLKKIEEFFERAPQVKYQLALAYFQNGNAGRAEDYLHMALRLSPNYDEAVLLLAELHIQKGSPATARTLLLRLLQTRYQVPRAYVLLAQAYRAENNPGKALEVLQLLASGNAKSPHGPYLVGNLLMELGRSKEAREAFGQSLGRAGTYWPSVEGLVNLDLAEQQSAAAAERIKILLEKTPDAVPALLLRAKIRLMSGDSAGAEADLLKAIELDPKVQYPYLLLARIYLQSDRTKPALEKLRALAGQKPNLNVLVQIGMLHNALDQHNEARMSYEKALAIDPNFTPALNNLAVLYGEHLGQLEKAFELAKRAQTQSPGEAIVADTLAWILFRKGQYERGLRLAQQAAEKIPGDPEIQHRLGLCHYFLGQAGPARQAFQSALAAAGQFASKEDAARRLAILELDPASPDPVIRNRLERALRDDPGDPVVLDRLAQIELSAGQPREAAEHYEAVLKINAGSVPAMLALVDLNFGPLAKPERARELIKLVRLAEPTDPQIAWRLGRQLLGAGDFAAASPLLVDAARGINGQPELLLDQARSQYGLGRVADATKALESYLASGGSSPGQKQAARMATLLAAARQPVLREADLELAREALAENATDVPALMLLALDLERRNSHKEAVREYEKILRFNPLFAPAQRQLAILYAEHLGDDEKAEQLAQKARQTLTEDAELEYQLGVISFRRADYPGAVRFLQLSQRRRDQHAPTLFFLGMAQFQLKNSTEAKVLLQRALDQKLPPMEEGEARRVLDLIGRGGGL